MVGAARWTHEFGYLRGSGILRELRATAADNPATSALGWGLAASGNLVLPAFAGTRNIVLFEVSYGEGIGGYYDDYPPNAVYDPGSRKLEPLPVLAYYIGYNHGWSDTLSSGALYAWLEVDNLDSQPDDAFNGSAYFSVNLIWRPDTSLMFGVEFLRGGRSDKDGAEGTANRMLISSQFSF